MRHSYRCHVAPEELGPACESPDAKGCSVDVIDLLGTVRCPCCRMPLVTRMGREGPYFACRCQSEPRR